MPYEPLWYCLEGAAYSLDVGHLRLLYSPYMSFSGSVLNIFIEISDIAPVNGHVSLGSTVLLKSMSLVSRLTELHVQTFFILPYLNTRETNSLRVPGRMFGAKC